MKSPERPDQPVSPEEARELFKQIHKVVGGNLEIEDTPKVKIPKPKEFKIVSHADAQGRWEKEKEEKEDEHREGREAA